MDADTEQRMLDEIRNHTRLLKSANRIGANVVALLGILVVLAIVNLIYGDSISAAGKAREAALDSWRDARALVDKGDLQKGKEMIARLIAKNPRNYYGYRLMGFVEQEIGNLNEAEANFAKARDLFPTEENEKNLAAIRKVRATTPDTPH